jgi:3D (Asp-Asp-Asp) domain-containing protein
MFIAACAEQPLVQTSHHSSRARITFYHRFEDRFGAKTAMGIRAKEGLTVAGPKSIPLGTKITIPSLKGKIGDGNFIVQDRGSAVRNNHYDVYVECRNRADAKRRLRELELLEPFTTVYF